MMIITAIENLSPVTRTGLLVLGVLVVASVAVRALRLAKPEKDFSELTSRVRAWWMMAAVFFAAILVSNHVSLVFFAFLSFWAMKEFITLLKTRPADHHALVFTFLAIPIQYYWIGIGWYGMFIIFIPVYMLLALPVRMALSKETTGFVASASQIQWGMMIFVFGLSHMAYLLTFPQIGQSLANGRTLVLFLVFVVEMSDVLQYIWGKTLGRHKIIPTVSPNKTWEGFIGGIASAMLLSLAIRFLTPFSILETLMVSLFITVAGFCGGAVMSAVKRDFGVKDFGQTIPGHGGMLDRVDSLCYAAPFFFHYVRFFYTKWMA
ncbi:MAG TPA: phosphatidate cytidylyltransferase [Blastocatellia bacterium]|nr:phosphatidate cytidylyltransferase [Blastocatellia bacterium]